MVRFFYCNIFEELQNFYPIEHICNIYLIYSYIKYSYIICLISIGGNFVVGYNYLPRNELNLLKSYSLETVKLFHLQGIAHRDIRAPNFIFKDEKAFIIDFGFPKITNAQEHFDNDLIRLNGKIF